ncbi:MAG: energy transducer TonB [Myroides sp.]
MKNLIFLLLCLLSFGVIQAQHPGKPSQKEVIKDENHIYKFVQKKAEPKEGYQAFFECFLNEFKKPTLPKDIKEIRVRLRFLVEKDGSFSDIQIIEDKYNIGEEAIRVLKIMPKWNPAMHDGKMVRTRFTLPIKIILD